MEEAIRQQGLPRPEPAEKVLIVAGFDADDREALTGGLELAASALGSRLVGLTDVAQAVDEVVRVRELGAFPALVLGSRVADERVARAARVLAGRDGAAPVVRWGTAPTEETLEQLLSAGCCDVVQRREGGTDALVRAARLAFEISRRRWAEAQAERSASGDGVPAEMAIEARRYAGTGRLLVSVSHDLNNLLQPLIGYLELLADRLDPASEEAEYAAVAGGSARLAGTLAGRLLRLSRSGELTRQAIDPDRLLDSLAPLVRAIAGARVRLGTVLTAPGARVLMPEGALEQIALNLVANARDAMPAGGTLTLRTRRVGASWCFEVEDTGTGIRPGDAERAFDSGYTTKGPGRGSGLGLWIVRSLATDAGGTVGIERQAAGGTKVRVLLPTMLAE